MHQSKCFQLVNLSHIFLNCFLTLSDKSSVAKLEKKKNGPPDRHKVLIIVGVNMGILLVAGMIGMMCYNKRTFQGPYHKVPGTCQRMHSLE